MSTPPITTRGLDLPAGLILILLEAADAAVRRSIGKFRRKPPKRGLTLQVGIDTPLWNELVRQVVPLLRRRGSKVHLARILGVPRQRLQVCLKAKSACLDAERTLLLLAWLARQRRGQTLV
ncbi:MAG: hypothetical protein JWQ62_3022 [Lacunisphaera sp.]|nr:hypothetical protein [Lacunisphaera sp.]